MADMLDKNLEEKLRLTIPIEFLVVEAEYHTNTHTSWNGADGPGCSIEMTGKSPTLLLRVSSRGLKETEKIQQLRFEGFAVILAGDFIRAYIQKYDVREGKSTGAIIAGEEIHEKIYKERPYREHETVTNIEKVDRYGRTVARFLSDSTE